MREIKLQGFHKFNKNLALFLMDKFSVHLKKIVDLKYKETYLRKNNSLALLMLEKKRECTHISSKILAVVS